MSIPYRDRAGDLRQYPQNLNVEALKEMAAFLKSGPPMHTMIEIAMGAVGTAVRHDVDHSLVHAAKFARWEMENGIRSTYFILPTAWYWTEKGKMKMLLDAISSYGHEIGLHHDSLTQAKEDGRDGSSEEFDQMAQFYMRQSAETLRGMGFNCFGCAAHGAYSVDNLAVWDRWKLADFGLKYEAYHLNAGCNYISDNRGIIRAPLEHVEGQQARVLIHPEHWQLAA